MSKTTKDALSQVTRREEQLYNDKNAKLKGIKKYQRSKADKRLRNAIRSNDIDTLLDLDT